MMWDCVIIGGGAAGLTAATYLGRFRRRVLLIDAGESRMKRIPLTRNAPGFPDGIKGAVLHQRMREQAGLYGAAFEDGAIDRIEVAPRHFKPWAGAKVVEARTVLLATGSCLVEPDMPDIDQALPAGSVSRPSSPLKGE